MTDQNVTDIKDARAKKKRVAEDIAPFEAYEAEHLQLSPTDFLISACDGEQAYAWIASKPHRRKTFKVVEVYPGLDRPKTDIREASSAEDLILDGKWSSLDELKADLTDIVFEGLEIEGCEDGSCDTE
jgi:hypothetical protein